MVLPLKRCWKAFYRCSKGLLALLVAGAAAVHAQPFDLEPIATVQSGYLRLESVGPDAAVAVNGSAVPTRAVGGDLLVGPLAAGDAALTVWPDGQETWNGRQAQTRVAVVPADTVRVAALWAARTVVTSVPYGARVVVEQEGQPLQALGTTPLTYDSEAPLTGTLVVEADGYAPARLALAEARTERHAILLRPLPGDEAAPAGVYTYGATRNTGRRWIDYAAAGLAVAGAATAIYYKFEADALDDRYRDVSDARYADPALLREAERLDTASLVGLGAMQLGVGVLAVRFVLR